MQTHKYSIKTKMTAEYEQSDMIPVDVLESKLKDGPSCLMAYAIFPTDGDILEHVDYGRDKDGNLESINIHTYSRLWDGMESDLFDCVRDNITDWCDDNDIAFSLVEFPEYGKADYLGREGSIPETLYHIAEAEDLEDISRDGLIPGSGKNAYKDHDVHTYLAEEKDLAAWVTVLPHVKEPVILEVNTRNINVEYGRHFSDRDYLPEGYGEYRTSDYIQAGAVTEADLHADNNRLQNVLTLDVLKQVAALKPDDHDISEVHRGLDRLVYMGVMSDVEADMTKKMHQTLKTDRQGLAEQGNDRQDLAEQGNEVPWDKTDNGRDISGEMENNQKTSQETEKLWKYQFRMENIKPVEVGPDTIYSPLNSDMAPYESSRFEELLKASRIPGRSNIEAARFEPNPDGSVNRMNLYMKHALTKDMEQRTASYIMDHIVPAFNEQSDDVKIKLDDMERIGKVDTSDKDFENDFDDAMAALSEDSGLKL